MRLNPWLHGTQDLPSIRASHESSFSQLRLEPNPPILHNSLRREGVAFLEEPNHPFLFRVIECIVTADHGSLDSKLKSFHYNHNHHINSWIVPANHCAISYMSVHNHTGRIIINVDWFLRTFQNGFPPLAFLEEWSFQFPSSPVFLRPLLLPVVSARPRLGKTLIS